MTNDKFHRIAAYVLVVICSGLFILLWAERDEKQKGAVYGTFVQAERDSLARVVISSQMRLDSLMTRDSLLAITYDQLPAKYERLLITNRSLSNDSLRRLLTK